MVAVARSASCRPPLVGHPACVRVHTVKQFLRHVSNVKTRVSQRLCRLIYLDGEDDELQGLSTKLAGFAQTFTEFLET